MFYVTDWMFVCSQNLYVETLSPNVMMFEDGAPGRLLRLDEVQRTRPSDEISVFMRKVTRKLVFSLSLSAHLSQYTVRREMYASQEKGLRQNPTILFVILILDFQPPELWEDKFLLFQHSFYGTLLWKSKQTNAFYQRGKAIFFKSIIKKKKNETSVELSQINGSWK